MIVMSEAVTTITIEAAACALARSSHAAARYNATRITHWKEFGAPQDVCRQPALPAIRAEILITTPAAH